MEKWAQQQKSFFLSYNWYELAFEKFLDLHCRYAMSKKILEG